MHAEAWLPQKLDMHDPLTDLTRAIGAHLAHSNASPQAAHAEIDHLQRAVRAAEVRPQYAAVPARDYGAILGSAIDVGIETGIAAIATALGALPRALPWDYQYSPRPGAGDLARKIGFAELIGPDGPMDAPHCRVGFTLIAPNTLYPAHAHPATELYLVISGHAEWSASGVRRIVPPGGFVLHQSNEPHAMRTFAEPLLALYSWSGDLDTAAFYL